MSFSFGGGGAGGGTVQQQPPTGSGLFGGAVAAPQPPQAVPTSSQPQAPQTTSFSFGSSAAPASAPVSSTNHFGAAPAAAAPLAAPAPAPAPAPGGLFGAASPSQEQQPPQQQPQQQQQQQPTSSALTPALASSLPFSFGGLASAAGAGATTPATAPATSSTAVATSSTSGSAKASSQSVVPRKPVKVDLRSLFDGALTDPCLFSDEEMSEQLDLLLEPGGPSASASEALKCALRSSAFRERAVASFEEDSARHFYGVATEQTGKDFDSFANGQKRMSLLHGWDAKRNASELQGKVDLVEGVKALARYLRLGEERAMQVLFLYLKDQVRLGLVGEMDSREYASLALHDRIRRFYHNQRVFFLKNMQELLRIDLDPDYFQPELRHEVQQLLDGLSHAGAGAPSFVDRLQGAFRSLCHDMPPRVQDLSRAYPGTMTTQQGHSPVTWERVRQEWVEQNVVEQAEVLTLLLLVLAQRVSLGFGSWCQLLDLWRDLRMGELAPEKAYLIAEDEIALRRARRVSGLMTLVAIQGLQLGSLALPPAAGGIGGEEHPFAPELMQLPKGGAVQIEELFYAMRDPARAEEFLVAPELISVVLLFFTCFLHLSGPGLRPHLSPDLQRRFWDRAAELQAYVTQRAAQAHLAELVATLLLDDEEAAGAVATTATPDAGGPGLDQWARLGFHAVLRREADRLRPGVSRPEVEALQVPLSDAVNALVAACYAGLPQGPPPMHHQSMTTKKVEFFVFLVATIYHGHSPLAYCFWEASGLAAGLQLEAVEDATGMQLSTMEGRNKNAGHPLEYLATEARERHPLLYFHLVASMACDAATATWVAVELSRAPLSTQAYDERVLEHLGERSYRVQQESAFFDPETGVSVPSGTQGELVQEPPGRVPRIMRWDMSLWGAILHQLEDFAGFLARYNLLPMMDTLEGLRRKAVGGEGLQELSFNTVVDRCPSLFVYGPCPARTEDVVRELVRRGAWGMVRYILRRVEMVLDQFSLLLAIEQRQQQQQARRKAAGGRDDPVPLSLLDVLTEADGVSTVGMAPLAHRLPARLFDLVRVASEALTGRTEEAEVEALVDLQVSALSLLGRLVRTHSPLPWRAQAVQTLVMEVGDPAGGQERVPVIVWLGLRSMEAERTLNQYRITRFTLLLMHSLVESACDVNWEGKEMVLPSGLSNEFVTRLVDFSTKVLLFLETWTFTRSLDRWLLALTCLDLLAIYSSRPFAATTGMMAEESTWGLEVHRQSLLRRFRQDGALMRMLLRCAEYLPASALHDTLKTRTKRKMPYRFLDQLHPGGVEEELAEEAQGLFFARGGILPLAFDHKGLGSTASREEMAVLRRLGAASLKMLSYVIKYYLASPTTTAPSNTWPSHSSDAAGPGALDMMMQGADTAFSGSRSQDQSLYSSFNQAGGRRRPLVTHVTLIASLVTYGEGEAAGGVAGVHLSVAAMEWLGLVVRYLQRNRRLRQKELMATLPDWPHNLPYPYPPGVMEDILSVTDAQGFRRGLFAALARRATSGGVLVAMLDLLVDVMKLQPSLAKHLVFFRPRPAASSNSNSSSSRKEGGEEGADQRVEEVLLAVLRKAQGIVQADLDRECQRQRGKGGKTRMREVREGGSGMLVLASALRFLCVCLRRATPARRLELLSLLDPEVWGILEWAVQNVILEEATEVKVAEVQTHCHRLSVHRFVLEILSLLTTVMIDTQQQQQQQGGESRAQTLRSVEAAVPKMIKALLGGPHVSALLNQYLTASFRPEFVEDLSRRAAGPHDEIPLTQFRLPDWGVMLTDSNPSRFGAEGFFFDLPAVVRHLHATQVGAEMGEEKRMDVERAVRLLNQYYSISAAQHMVNKACKGLLMVLIGRVRPAIGQSEVWNGSVNIDDVAHTTLHLLVGDSARLLGGRSAFEGPGRESSSSGSGGIGRSDDPTKEAARQLRADSVDVARKMRQPMLELVLTIVDSYAPGLSEDMVNDTLRTVQQSFQEFKTEDALLQVDGVVGFSSNRSSSEVLLLDLRQCLLTTSLILLQCHPLDGTGYIMSGQSQLDGILAYTIGTLSSLDTLLVEGSQEPLAPTCRSERLDAVLRTAVALLGTLLMPRTHEPDMSMPALSGGDKEKQSQMQEEQQQQQEEAEIAILREFQEHRILSTLLRHWTAASKVAAAAFAALHDYTTVSGHAARSTAAQEALADMSVDLAVKRLSTLLRFLEAAACTSKEFCRELLQEGLVTMLMEDPVVACLVRAVEGGAHVMGMEQLLYRRGYRADGEESPYYALWRGLVRLMARLLHSLTRPHLGYEAVLALPLDERDPSLAYANPLTPGEATVVREIAGFWRRLSLLLLWPLGEDKVLTLGLLREAQSVLTLAREMAVHGYTWRVAEPARAEELRALIKGMVVRTSLVLGQVQSMAGSDGGTPVLSVLREAFAPVSPEEARQYRLWEERCETEGNGNGKSTSLTGVGGLEEKVNDMLIAILGSALGFLRYTGPLRLPKHIPLTSEEAAQVVFAEGTRVWYRKEGSQGLEEGIVKRRVLEFHPQEACRMGTYDLVRRRDHRVETGVRPERVAIMEDRQQDQDQAQDFDFDLLDSGTGVPSFNNGKLSVAHLLVLARYALDSLRRLPTEEEAENGGEEKVEKARAVREEREGHCTNLLIHALYLLLVASRSFLRARGGLIQNKERVLPRFIMALMDVLWDATEWRHGRYGAEDGTYDNTGGDGGGSNSYPHGSSSFPHHHTPLHDMFASVSEADSAEERLVNLRDRIDQLVGKMRAGQELEAGELQSVLTSCFRCMRSLPSGLPARLVAEAGQHGYEVGLGDYAAALRASSQDPKLARMVDLLDDMIETVGLPTLLQELNRKARAAGSAEEEGGIGLGISYLMLPE